MHDKCTETFDVTIEMILVSIFKLQSFESAPNSASPWSKKSTGQMYSPKTGTFAFQILTGMGDVTMMFP